MKSSRRRHHGPGWDDLFNRYDPDRSDWVSVIQMEPPPWWVLGLIIGALALLAKVL